MNATNTASIIVLCASCVALACGPKRSTAAEEPGPPVADHPVGEAPEPKADEAPPSKCFAEGGTCVHEKATLACKRFEEGEEWGCTDEDERHTGCCFQ